MLFHSEDAAARLDSLVKTVGESTPLKLALGSLSFRHGDLKSAESAFRQAVALDPKSSGAHYALGNLLWLQNDLKSADAELKTAYELSPVSIRPPAEVCRFQNENRRARRR